MMIYDNKEARMVIRLEKSSSNMVRSENGARFFVLPVMRFFQSL